MERSMQWSVGATVIVAAWIAGSALHARAGGPHESAGGGGGGDAPALAIDVEVPPGEIELVVVDIQSPGRALDVALRRAGISPASLAAAGVGTGSFASALAASDSWLLEQQENLAQIDAGCGAARRERDSLQRRVRSGLAAPEEIAALQQAKATLATREEARDGALLALFSAATAGLSGPQVTALAAIRANAGQSSPVYYRVEQREPATWLLLRDALANERIAPLFEDEPDSGAQSFLSSMHARQAVAQARANHTAYLAALEASWQASLHGQH